MPRIPKKRYGEVVTLYRKGLTQKQIANRFGVSQPTVSNILERCISPSQIQSAKKARSAKKKRVALRQQRRDDFHKEKLTESVRLYEEGLTQKQIADRLGVSPALIHRILERAMTSEERAEARRRQPGRSKISPNKFGELPALYLLGFTQWDIADHYGVSQAYVGQILKDLLTPAQRSEAREARKVRRFTQKRGLTLQNIEQSLAEIEQSLADEEPPVADEEPSTLSEKVTLKSEKVTLKSEKVTVKFRARYWEGV